MKDEKCRVVENRALAENYYLLKIETGDIAGLARPGNFVMVRILSQALVPLLRRPFAILGAREKFIWIYYQVVGQGTRLLADLKENEDLVILGPLGNSFVDAEGKRILLIAGGRGIAPLLFAAEKLAPANQVILLYGGKSQHDLNLIRQIESLPLQRVILYSEDGSMGRVGLVTQEVSDIIREHAVDMTFSCGPEPMLQGLSATLQHTDTDDFVSMEAAMGCGFGICHSCAVKTVRHGYQKVCSDGPIFRMEDIDWQTLV